MKAPISEIPSREPRRPAKKPPRSLSVMVGIGLALGIFSSILFLTSSTRLIPDFSPFWETTFFLGILFLLHFLPLLLVWRGANWARWLCIAASVFMIATFLVPPDPSLPRSKLEHIVDWTYLPYNLALIIFLLMPPMRRYFTQPPVSLPEQTESTRT